MENSGINPTAPERLAALYAAWFALFAVIFMKAWVCEDAYITFRVIDNFVEGYGLRWNINERVQVYTHPFWLLLQLPLALLFDNIYLLNIGLSIACTMLAVAVALLSFRKSLGVMLVCFMIPLFLSKCFLDYATSGLETSLSYLLFALFGAVITHARQSPKFLLWLTLSSALLMLNRLDHIILIGPVIAYFGWLHWERIKTPSGIAMLAAGALPLVLWFSFSLVYYGFPFPNTKYAKLDTGFPISEYLAQGIQYAFIWLTHDAASLMVMLAALAVGFRNWRKEPVLAAVGAGILLNYIYVLYIGGDYMMGRFYAIIFFASAWLLLASVPSGMRDDVLFAATVVLFLGFAGARAVMEIREECEDCVPVKGRVMDATATFRTNSLFRNYWPPVMNREGHYKFAYEGRDMAKKEIQRGKVLRFVGMAPFYAGNEFIFIDELALCDAFLARLPAAPTRRFYVGHYRRNIPKGYEDAVRYGNTDGMHPGLAKYYEKIKLITQGDLFDKERLVTIIRFNFGQFEHYKKDYLRVAR